MQACLWSCSSTSYVEASSMGCLTSLTFQYVHTNMITAHDVTCLGSTGC